MLTTRTYGARDTDSRRTTWHQLAIALALVVVTTVAALTSRPLQAQSEDLFPRPAELEPAIRFWTRVYTEVDTSSGYLHDANNLGIIYRRVDYNRQEVERQRQRIQADLRVLATGQRDGLTAHQEQVLAAWPAGVSNEELLAAAGSVRFQLGQSNRFVAGLIRSGAYREHISRVAHERGVPEELGALPHVESSFHPGAYSHAQAAGMWQFMRTTGQRFMRIDNIIDERMDPYAATYAAMSLLEYNYNLLGSWPLALTAYNHGAGGMARAVREVGSDRIEDIIAHYKGPAFGFAGRNFYPQFLAVQDVERQAQALFGVLNLDAAPEYEEFELQAYVEVDTLAAALGVTQEQLRFDNPALRPIVWEGGKRIPKGYKVKVQKNSINGTLASAIASISDHQLYAYQTPDVNYTVQSGDSLSVIARRFNTSVSQLVSLNGLTDQHRIRVGQALLLPHDTNMVTQTLAAADTAPIVVTPGDSYVIRSGDTISSIARRYGVSEAALLRLNTLASPDRIRVGQSLRLPASDDALVMTASYTDAVDGPRPRPVSDDLFPDASIEASLPQQPIRASAEDSLLTATITAASQHQVAVELQDNPGVTGAVVAEQLAAADPADYSVGTDRTVEIQASETLGHFAGWLGMSAQELRRLNGLGSNQPLIVGNRLKVDFNQVNQAEFELRRRQFHLAQQEDFFRNYRINNVSHHQLAANENIATLARRNYSVPLWLLRQYNPDVDFNRVRVGQTIVFPVLARVDGA